MLEVMKIVPECGRLIVEKTINIVLG